LENWWLIYTEQTKREPNKVHLNEDSNNQSVTMETVKERRRTESIKAPVSNFLGLKIIQNIFEQVHN